MQTQKVFCQIFLGSFNRCLTMYEVYGTYFYVRFH
jgi:hypothetical protein